MITLRLKSLMKKNLKQMRQEALSHWERTSYSRRLSLMALGIGLALGWAAFSSQYRLALNVTDSLSGHLYLIKLKDSSPYPRGTLIAFRWAADAPIPKGTTVIKEVAGVAGDRISHDRSWVFITDQKLCIMKSRSKSGRSLTPGPTGIIPENHYYAHAPHPDSLDSRYEKCGLIHATQIVGEAIELF